MALDSGQQPMACSFVRSVYITLHLPELEEGLEQRAILKVTGHTQRWTSGQPRIRENCKDTSGSMDEAGSGLMVSFWPN